jgi:hypothetical protein
MMPMMPINLWNYAIIRDKKPHSRETKNREPLKSESKQSAIMEILKGRSG